MSTGANRSLRGQWLHSRTEERRTIRDAAARAVGRFVEALETRQLLSIVAPSHIVVVVEEDRAANAIGDTANMPYLNQLASEGLVYSNSFGLNTTSQAGQMNYLALYSGSTQGVTTDNYSGPFKGGNLAQSLNNDGLSFSGYAEAMPRSGDTTDAYAASPTDKAYDDLYIRAYNPMAQFSNVGTGKTNAQVNQTFASFPTTAAGYAALPTISYVIPDTLDNTHGSNDTSPYATDPSQYNFLRHNADTWLKNNLSGYVQWAQQNNSILIITGDEGDRAHGFTSFATNKVTTIIVGDSRIVVPGVDTTSINPYNLLRSFEDMYGLTPLGNTVNAADLDVNAQGKLAAPGQGQAATTVTLTAGTNPTVFGQSVTFTAVVTASGSPTGTVTFQNGSTILGTGTLNASGVATLSTSSLLVGTHSITATYGGSASFLPSMSAVVSDTVNKAATSTVVGSSSSTSVFGQGMTFTATVAATSPGAGTPTGTVQFVVDGANFGNPVVLSNGSAASSAINSLSVGGHSVAAIYSSDANFVASTAPALTQTVSKASTTTSVVSSALNVTFGQSVTFTATVAPSAPGAGTPTGTVRFIIDGANFGGPVALSGGSALSGATNTLALGSHSVSAVYSSDANFTASTSGTITEVVTSTTPPPAVNFANGFSGQSTLQLNGSAAVSGSALQLTNGGIFQDASAFTSSAVNVSTFTTSFDFQLSAGTNIGHGFTFTIQGQGPTALGQSGGGLGYGNDYAAGAAVITKSVAVKFDLYSNEGEGSNSTGLFTDGANPTLNASNSDLTPSGVNLHSGDKMNVQMSYDGTTLNVTIKDTVTGATARQSYVINIPATVGGNTAYVGFTGATGGLTATQSILDWTFSSSTTVGALPPAAPSGLTATVASGTSIALNWTNTATGVTGFQLDRATDSGFTQNLASQILPATPNSYTDTGLTAGTTYYYRLRVVTSAGTSANSTTASATPVAIPTVNFANGFTGESTLQLNGSAAVSGSALQLTNGGIFQAASAFTSSAVTVSTFTTSFDFQISPGANIGHGITFTIQGQGPTALGQSGGGLGYGDDYDPTAAVITKSVAVKFDLYSNEGEGSNSTGLFTDGANPTLNASNSDLTPSGVNLHGGDKFNVQMSYDGTTLNVTIKDTVTGATASQSYVINIAATVGGNTAYVGFTGATGLLTSTQSILDWTFSNN